MRIRPRTAVVTAVPLAAASLLGAHAWVTASGSGDTTLQAAQIQKLVVNVTQHGGTDPIPVGGSQPVDFSVTNPNKISVALSQVQVTIKPGNSACPPGSFVLNYGGKDYADGAVIPVTGTKLPNGTTPIVTATLKMVEVDGDQTTCANAPVKVGAVIN